jgi:hypothetical protein
LYSIDALWKYRHKEVQEVREKVVFLTDIESELDQFEEHVGRVKHQYEELRKLRENLPKGDVVVWMDLDFFVSILLSVLDFLPLFKCNLFVFQLCYLSG